MSAVKILDSHTGLLRPSHFPKMPPPPSNKPPPPLHPTPRHTIFSFISGVGGGGRRGHNRKPPGWLVERGVYRWVVVGGGVVEGRRRRGGGWGISDFGNIRKGTGPPGNRGGGRTWEPNLDIPLYVWMCQNHECSLARSSSPIHKFCVFLAAVKIRYICEETMSIFKGTVTRIKDQGITTRKIYDGFTELKHNSTLQNSTITKRYVPNDTFQAVRSKRYVPNGTFQTVRSKQYVPNGTLHNSTFKNVQCHNTVYDTKRYST